MKNYKMGSNRIFGFVFFLFFLILSTYPLLKNESLNFYFLFSGSVFLALGILNSKLLTPLNIFWTKLGFYLGKIVSPIVMFFIYFAIVFPTRIILILCKKDTLNIDFEKRKSKDVSYWNLRKDKITEMDNQF